MWNLSFKTHSTPRELFLALVLASDFTHGYSYSSPTDLFIMIVDDNLERFECENWALKHIQLLGSCFLALVLASDFTHGYSYSSPTDLFILIVHDNPVRVECE